MQQQVCLLLHFYKMKRIYLYLLFFLYCVTSDAQPQNNIWCFGDSAGIDFNTVPPSTFRTNVKGRGSCTSIADSSDNLLFYAYTRATLFGKTTLVFDYTNQLMDEGDSIVGEGWYQELTIINDPGNPHRYYLFSVGVDNLALQQGFWYSVIDMSYNSGLGKVVSKNNMLLNDFMADCVAGIKHGNGRDWWVVTRKSNTLTTGVTVTDYYFYLITPTGIYGPFIKTAGQPTNYNGPEIIFSTSGNKMIYTNPRGLLELYDFDRCSGDLTLNQTISSENTSYHFYWSSAFSPDESKLYVQTISYPDTTFLIQFNLNAANIASSADTIFTQPLPAATGGDIRLAPDGKIYVSNAYYDGFNFAFPYSDTTYNMYNTYLGVVNFPDSMGVSCDYQPYSFYLGGNRTYYGLPNNPNYVLGAVVGGICDTLTSIVNIKQQVTSAQLNVNYVQGWQKLFVNAQHIATPEYYLQVTNVLGEIIFTQQGKTQPPFFTKTINCSAWAGGIYFVEFVSGKQTLMGRFVKD